MITLLHFIRCNEDCMIKRVFSNQVRAGALPIPLLVLAFRKDLFKNMGQLTGLKHADILYAKNHSVSMKGPFDRSILIDYSFFENDTQLFLQSCQMNTLDLEILGTCLRFVKH